MLIYLDGDNNLEAAGIADVHQMEMAPASDAVNVLVQFDRSPNYDSTNGNWSGARRYKILHDTDPATINSALLQDLGPTDMGSSQVLEDFVTWGIQNYPADHYALILWDHGSGWKAAPAEAPVKSICWDETSGDKLTPADLESALGQARTALGRNLDVVACDACIMGALEVAYELRGVADYYVASEEDVPDDGFDYTDLLARLAATPSMRERDLARAMVISYRASYNGGRQGTAAVTLSALDLSHAPDLAGAISVFADALEDTVAAHPTYGADLHTWWELARITDDPGQVDLGYFVDLVEADAPDDGLRKAAANLAAALQETIVSDGVVQMDANARRGVSLYYPFNTAYDTTYSALDFAVDTTWDEFLNSSPTSGAYVGDRYEPDDSLEEAKPLTPAKLQRWHWFHVQGDVDVAWFQAEAGRTYFMDLENLGPRADPILSLVAANGSVLATVAGAGCGLSWTCPSSGTYYASVTQSLRSHTDVGGGTVYDIYVAPVSFADVPATHWAFHQIESCAVAGIALGDADGYHPGNAVDRAQMATYLARELAGGDASVPAPAPGTQSFGDVSASYWAYRYIEYCKSQNVVAGYGDGYHPDDLVDRGQMAAFIARAREPYSERPDLPSYLPPTAPSFADVTPAFWAFKDVEYCFEHEVVQGYPDGYHPERTVTRDQMAVFVARAFQL